MYRVRIIHPSAVSTEFNLWKPARTDFFSHFPVYHQSSYVEGGEKNLSIWKKYSIYSGTRSRMLTYIGPTYLPVGLTVITRAETTAIRFIFVTFFRFVDKAAGQRRR